MEHTCHALTPQFDRILSRIEAGQIDLGITHLAGLLDAVLIDSSEPEQVRCSLLAHPLGSALRQPALSRLTQRVGIAAAHDARGELARSTLDQARQRGDRCMVLEEHPAGAGTEQFDLILAANLADHLSGPVLALAILAAADRLAPGGRLVLSSFVPGHLGCGWQTLWLGQKIERHAPETIAAAARAAGLQPRLFYDASDCLVWAELRNREIQCNEGDR